MQRDIDQVMGSRMQAKQLTIRHVGDPRERMPVALVKTGKSPDHIAEIQTCADVNVLSDIFVVIEHELMMRDRTIQQQNGEQEQCAQQDRFLAQIGNQSLKGRVTYVCDLYHAEVAIQSLKSGVRWLLVRDTSLSVAIPT